MREGRKGRMESGGLDRSGHGEALPSCYHRMLEGQFGTRVGPKLEILKYQFEDLAFVP